MKLPFYPSRTARSLRVDWTDHAWTPWLVGRVSGAPASAHCASPLSRKTHRKCQPMTKNCLRARPVAGFTLIELLVVIAIIGILAGLLLPAVSRANLVAKKRRAAYEMQHIAAAVNQYETVYSRMPLSTAGAAALNSDCPDFTYGTAASFSQPGTLKNRTGQFLPFVGNVDHTLIPATYYQANNSELMAILMDQVALPDGVTPTVNAGHAKNPQQTHFLDAKMVSDNISPGVGADLVYRDPWGNPYIVTIDMNADNRVRDGFYRSSAVSQQAGAQGYNGLNNNTGVMNNFEANGTVMVWSLGPDGGVDQGQNATTSSNKDNITSW